MLHSAIYQFTNSPNTRLPLCRPLCWQTQEGGAGQAEGAEGPVQGPLPTGSLGLKSNCRSGGRMGRGSSWDCPVTLHGPGYKDIFHGAKFLELGGVS